MKATNRLIGLTAAAVALFLVLTTGAESADFHLKLDRSAPAADSSVVTPVSEVRLWFSQVPQLAPTRVRLMGPGEAMVEMGEVTAEEEDASIVYATVEGETPPGDYKVIWRTMAQDGHVIDGEFTFKITAAPSGNR